MAKFRHNGHTARNQKKKRRSNLTYCNKPEVQISMVKWLLKKTHVQEVVGLNRSIGYWMNIFTLICCKILNCLLQKPSKQRRGREWHIKKYIFDKFNLCFILVFLLLQYFNIFRNFLPHHHFPNFFAAETWCKSVQKFSAGYSRLPDTKLHFLP